MTHHKKTSILITALSVGALVQATSAQGGTPRRSASALKGRGMSAMRPLTKALTREADLRAFMKQAYPGRTYRTGLPNVRTAASFYAPTGSLYDGARRVLTYSLEVHQLDVVDDDLIIPHIYKDSIGRGVSLHLRNMSKDHAYIVQCPAKLTRRAHNAFAMARLGIVDHRGRWHMKNHLNLNKNNTTEHLTFVFDPSKDALDHVRVHDARIMLRFTVGSRTPASLILDAKKTCTIRALKRTSP